MLTVLSGGTGGCKLLDGIHRLDRIDPLELRVVVNTGDDVEISGNMVCPDLDSVLYTLAGLIDTGGWFGIQDDTFHTHQAIRNHSPHQSRGFELPPERQTDGRPLARNRRFSGTAEFMAIGDRDRATHILRTSLLDEGETLTGAMSILADSFGVHAHVLPMSNDPVSTVIKSGDERLHFQEFWVARDGDPEVDGVEFLGIEEAHPTGAVETAVNNPVLVSPSNPVTSIGPILDLPGVRERLEDTVVLAVSPFLDRSAFSGPADKFLKARELSPGTEGLLELYEDFLDGIVIHEEDPVEPSLPTLRTDTMMNSPEDRTRVASECVDWIHRLV